jgi:hypothetical protein
MRYFSIVFATVGVLVSGPAAYAQQAVQAGNGPLVVETIQNGWVFTPDVRATSLKGDTGALAGGYIGRMTDRAWVFGAGGYVLTNRSDNFNMWYGGPVVEYLFHADRAIGFGVRGLVGIGSATLPYSASQFVDPRRLAGRHGTRLSSIDPNATIGVHDDFFIAEPQANVMWNINAGQRLVFGAGYRQTANTPLGADLNGFSGSVSFQIGGK